MNNSTKKTIMALVLGLGLASATGATVNAISADQVAFATESSDKNSTAQVQSVSENLSADQNVNDTYGGCGLSCAGCSSKCF